MPRQIKSVKRNCEVCGSKSTQILHTQKFIISGKKEQQVEHDICVCNSCGFLFVSSIPPAEKIEKFYKANVKYAYHANQGKIPQYALKLHEHCFQLIDSYLKSTNPQLSKKDISILDVGCGSGYLLHCFKKNGYTLVKGLDPAPECKVIAKKLYDVDIVSATLSEYKNEKKFDLILLGSVLEHMSDLQTVIAQIRALLKKDGILFISVPDGDNFGTILHEPFLEFSLEHINFFTRKSLKNLLSHSGFKNSIFDSLPLKEYGGYALNSIWVKTDKKSSIVPDKTGKQKLSKYVNESKLKLEKIQKKIEKLIKSREKVIIWGVGSLTSRLFANTDLAKVNIDCFVDSNPSIQGNKLYGITIQTPQILKNTNATVFISSYIHKKAIKKIITDNYNKKNRKIVSL